MHQTLLYVLGKTALNKTDKNFYSHRVYILLEMIQFSKYKTDEAAVTLFEVKGLTTFAPSVSTIQFHSPLIWQFVL